MLYLDSHVQHAAVHPSVPHDSNPLAHNIETFNPDKLQADCVCVVAEQMLFNLQHKAAEMLQCSWLDCCHKYISVNMMNRITVEQNNISTHNHCQNIIVCYLKITKDCLCALFSRLFQYISSGVLLILVPYKDI